MQELRRWIDLIYPPRCPVCDRFLPRGEGPGLCEACAASFQEIALPYCRRCGLPLMDIGHDDERLCEACLRAPPAYEKARAVYLYEGGALEAVHRFKYGRRAHLARILGPRLADLARRTLPAGLRASAMPVPLHPKRLRERGFNQSLLLARHVAGLSGLELDYRTLQRSRNTPPQVTLGREERKKNVRTAFEVKPMKRGVPENVVLVDDVATTGSTLNACSRALVRAGAKRVFCLVLARAANRKNGT